jgi:cell division protein FtsL
MMSDTQWTLRLQVAAIVLLVIVVVGLIRWRHHDRSTKEVLDAIEGGRQQQSAEHQALQAEQRAQGGMIRRMLDRLGFLK